MASLPPKKPPLLKHNDKCPPPSPLTSQPVVLPAISYQEQHHSHVLRLLVIVMACMFGMLMFLCTVSVLLRYFYLRRYSRNNLNRRDTPILFHVNGDSPASDNDDDVDEEELAVVHPIWYIRTVGLQQSLIDSITVFKYKKDEGIIDGAECSVCLGEFEHDESLRLLPKCSHAFHIPCIDTWLRSHKNCPLCRAPVVRDVTEIRAVDQNNNNHTERNVSDDQSENEEAEVENSDEDDGSSGITMQEETQPLRRAVSVDSFSASVFRDVVVDLDTHNHTGAKVNSRVKDNNNNNKVVSVGKNGSSSSSSSSIFYKVGSSGRVMQKRTVSMRRSFSHNRKFLFSRHFRSQSSTLPL